MRWLTPTFLCCKDCWSLFYSLNPAPNALCCVSPYPGFFPFIKTSAIVKIDEGVDNVLEFEDKEKYWDIVFSLDMILWIASLFIDLQKPYSTIYHLISEGLFAIWLIHIIVISKRYFRISTYQKRLSV